MNQLTLSFRDEILLQLKATNWEFKSKPDSLNEINKANKFIGLDRSPLCETSSTAESESRQRRKTGNPDIKPAASIKGKSLKKDK